MQGSTSGFATSDIVANATGNASGSANATIQTIDGAFESFVSASWDELASRLIFTASKLVPTRQLHTITVLATEGIRISTRQSALSHLNTQTSKLSNPTSNLHFVALFALPGCPQGDCTLLDPRAAICMGPHPSRFACNTVAQHSAKPCHPPALTRSFFVCRKA